MELSAKDMGENVQLICRNEGCSVFQLRDETGEGLMTFYTVFPGVYLLYNDFHIEHCVSGFHSSEQMLCIDHCREGCIEWDMGQNRYIYIEAGDMQINTRVHHTGNFSFPLRHYHGLTIGFLVDEAEQTLAHVMDGFSVDLRRLKEKYCPEGRQFILRAGKQIEHIFMELYALPEEVRLPYFKIKVLELLLFLDSMEISAENEERPYFYKSQVDKIKSMTEFMTGDLEQWHTLDELSDRFDFPITSMKKCFKGIYGTSVYAYMKAYRMNAAALALKRTDKTVAEIALEVGYSNPGKFASAFHSVIGMTPTEYRKTAV